MICTVQIIQVRREEKRLLFFQNAYYRRALIFRKAYRCAASTKCNIESRFDRLQNSHITMATHFLDLSSLEKLKSQVTSSLQLASDSFHILQWFYSSVISKPRRRAARYLRLFAAQIKALEYSAIRLYRASGRLAFGEELAALPFSMPILWSINGPNDEDWEDWENSRQVALKWSVNLENALRKQLNGDNFLSLADIHALCQRLTSNTCNEERSEGFEHSFRTLGLRPVERRNARVVSRLKQLLVAKEACQHQVNRSLLLLRAQEFLVEANYD